MRDLTFPSGGDTCAAWHLPATDQRLAGPHGRPAVVMAHGFACTRDGGLLPFAARFAAAGFDVVLFDYRGFGTSGGQPRQDVDHRRHREDYHAALAATRALDGVDPDRVALWGTSYSGGHVVAVAAQDNRVAAVVSQGAAMDGLALVAPRRGRSRRPESATEPPTAPARPPGTPSKGAVIGRAVARDALRRLRGGPPVTVAVFGAEGEPAIMTSEAGIAGLQPILGATFRNEICARGLLRIATNRPVRRAHRVTCPMFLVVAERDEIAPAEAVRETGRRAGGPVEVLAFECEHFAIYLGEVFEASVSAQVDFLRRQLAR